MRPDKLLSECASSVFMDEVVLAGSVFPDPDLLKLMEDEARRAAEKHLRLESGKLDRARVIWRKEFGNYGYQGLLRLGLVDLNRP